MEIHSISETDAFTKRRLDNGDFDYDIDLNIVGVCIGDTGKVRWRVIHDDDLDPEYLAEVLERVIVVMRHGENE